MIGALLKQVAAREPDTVAFVDGDRRLTYAEWDWLSDRAAFSLWSEGIRPGHTVALLLNASFTYPIAYLGAAKIGANYDALSGDPGTQAVIASILRDEQRHVEYLGSWLKRFESRLSRRFVASTLERLQEAFDQLDAAFYGAFNDYLERAAA